MPDREVAAMLDCEDGEKDRNSNCRHCQGGDRETCSQHQRYWDIQLDQDLLDTIASIYPEWFKDMSDGGRLLSVTPTHHSTTDKNKESLKVKLMLRRPLNQLVDQGILPSLKSPPAFHEQRQKLERAKMGDILKHKLQKRPDRPDIIQQHILEDPCIDSSHPEKPKHHLKKQSSLNGLLTQRPIDLMHSEELLAQTVRESALPLKSPCGTPSPKVRSVALDDDSGSDGAFSPSPPYDFSEHSQSSLPSLEASEPSSSNLNHGSPCSLVTSFSMSPPSSSVSSPLSQSVFSAAVSPDDYLSHMHHQHKEATAPHRNNNSSNSRKKTKPKTQPKARTIKFHEYRGPPNAPKNSSAPSVTTESSELWLQQQQLFLRLQQECMQNHINTPTPIHSNNNTIIQKPSGDQIVQTTQASNATQQLFESPNSPQKLLSNFEDLKVTDLRAELKKKGLPVSGSKPQLIKRLRSHIPSSSPTPPPAPSSPPPSAGLLLDEEMSAEQIKGLLDAMDEDEGGVEGGEELSNEDIVQLQQIWIEKLQRDLERSRKQLQQCQIPAAASANNSSPLAKAEQTAATTLPFNKNDESVAENKAAQRQIIHQILQQKIQQQELQKAQQRQQGTTNASSSSNPNSTLTALLKSSPLNASPLDMDLAKVDLDLKPVAMEVPVQDSKRDLLSEEDFSTITLRVDNNSPMDSTGKQQDDYPGVIPIFVCHADANSTVLSPPNALSNRSSSLPSFSALLTKPPPARSNTDPQFQLARPPPNYNEATRQLKVKQHHLTPDGSDGNPRQSKKHKSSIKSQAVDDVLEILINNGELSPSAAQDPITPVSISSDHPNSLPLFVSSTSPFFANTSPNLMTTTANSGTKDQQPFFTSKSLTLQRPKDEDRLQMVQSLLTPSSGQRSKDSEEHLKIVQSLLTPITVSSGQRTKKDEDHLKIVQSLLSPLTPLPGQRSKDEDHLQIVQSLLTPSPRPKDEDHLQIVQSLLTPSPGQRSKDEDRMQMVQSLLTPITSSKKLEVHHPFFSKPTSLKLVPTTSSKELDLQLAQSLMDLTPPSSTGFAAPSSSSLDFDFPLDMTDIDAMELDGLDTGHQTTGLDPSLSAMKPLDFGIGGKSADLASHLMRLTEMGDLQDRMNDRGIDNDIIEFLGDFEETSGHSSANFPNNSFGIHPDSDPLFSSSDFFCGEDLDFKPHHDLNFLPWGENAT